MSKDVAVIAVSSSHESEKTISTSSEEERNEGNSSAFLATSNVLKLVTFLMQICQCLKKKRNSEKMIKYF